MSAFIFFHYGIHQSSGKPLKMFEFFPPTKLFAISHNFTSPQIHFSVRLPSYFLWQDQENGKIGLEWIDVSLTLLESNYFTGNIVI